MITPRSPHILAPFESATYTNSIGKAITYLPVQTTQASSELNLLVRANDFKAAKKKLEEAIIGYLETVLETDDPISIPALLNRGKIRHRIAFEAIRAAIHVHKIGEYADAFCERPPVACHASVR